MQAVIEYRDGDEIETLMGLQGFGREIVERILAEHDAQRVWLLQDGEDPSGYDAEEPYWTLETMLVERADGKVARVMLGSYMGDGDDLWTAVGEQYPEAYDTIPEDGIWDGEGCRSWDMTFLPGSGRSLAAWLKEGDGFKVQVSDALRPDDAHGTDIWCEGTFQDLDEAIAKAREEARSKPPSSKKFRKSWVEDADGECVWSSDEEASE